MRKMLEKAAGKEHARPIDIMLENRREILRIAKEADRDLKLEVPIGSRVLVLTSPLMLRFIMHSTE